MSPETIRQKIQEVLPGSQVETSGADCNFAVVVTSDAFEGKSPLQRHRIVNDIFKADIESGALHALSIKTQTPA
ncbi:BolA family protein [Thiomicrorhabdus xiamenensis]|uniref:BolA/IbaG family iron-sulfur metabolism protein n=1 Tax=Thiomicrorhabdus xiamenensis TaxID=2739063 RepID=A0A7D4NS87_9GAMM|nr:BolA/IbaG family iron-sulfur metabolism protein [Thiomicrorhabdus xiamenensis]QKI89737.1 BolA/IbaG family iron-sulfur metabolism protein [Thiomicrorhabdus xiamenensis]